jgi:hypothetical protein
MTRSAVIGTLLTFLMALLVLVAAVVFLWQGRQTLLERNETLQVEATAIEADRLGLEAGLGSEQAALATTQALLATRGAEFDLSQQEIIDLQQEVTALQAQLEAGGLLTITLTPPAASAEPPTVEIALPVTGTTVATGTPVDVIVLVHHPAGVAEVNISVNGVSIETVQVGDRLGAIIRRNFPPVLGENVISVVATSTLGIASEPVMVILEAEPTQGPQTVPQSGGPTATPTRTPSPTSPAALPTATATPDV